MGQANGSMLLVGGDPALEGRLAGLARGLSVVRAAGPAAVADSVARLKPAAALVTLDAGGDHEASFEAVGSLARGGLPVIVLGPSKDAELILRAMRAGAREYVVAGDEQQLAQAVRASARPESDEGAGRVVTVFGAKGGIGATAIAANLGAALARRGRRTCLADLDLAFGDALSQLDLQSTYSIADVVANMHRLDRELLDSSLVRHRSGLCVVGQSDKLEDAERVRPADVSAFLGFARRHFQHVVVDGVRGFDEAALAALDTSDSILLVVTQEVPAVRNAQRAIEVFRRLGYEAGRLLLVVNRFHKHAQITPQLLTETTGLPVAATLENDFGALVEAINRGVPLAESAPRSPLVRDLDRLASSLEGACAQPAQRSIFKRLFARG